MSMLPSVGPQRMGEHNLSRAPGRARRAGADRPGPPGPGDARRRRPAGGTTAPASARRCSTTREAVLKRAGERLRLSGNHTVVALAGGTGSGKSTLFNALSGATFSPPGVTRPMTRHVHACVWGMQGAAPLLDWLGVQRRHRYARASVLDSGESDLDGLILLDLPDHDSVVTASMAAVDRLSKLADMVIWVLDPQKYADAAVHNRYLIPLAGHAAVFTVVLNQIDVLSPQQARDCEEDLRRLLDAEGLLDTPVLAGLRAHRRRAGRAARPAHGDGAQNRAVSDRIAADIDAMIGGFAAYAGPQVAPDTALARRPTARRYRRAAGRTRPRRAEPRPAVPAAVGPRRGRAGRGGGARARPSRPPWEDATPDGVKRERRRPGRQRPEGGGGPAHRRVRARRRADRGRAGDGQRPRGAGGPAHRLAGRPAARRPPRPGRARCARAPARRPRAADAAVGQAQQSEVDNAITAFADAVGSGLPDAVGRRPARRRPVQRGHGAAGARRRRAGGRSPGQVAAARPGGGSSPPGSGC